MNRMKTKQKTAKQPLKSSDQYIYMCVCECYPRRSVPSPDKKGGGLGVGPTPTPHKNLPATETTAKKLTSPGRQSEADHANGFMTAGDQSREDVSSSIAVLLTPKRLTRVGF